MIIYGSRASHLLTAKLDTPCKKCNTENSVRLSIFQKYAHVFWIPFFPMSRVAATECAHCKKVTEENKFSSDEKSAYWKLKENVKTPIWMFSGLALVAFLIAFVFINDKLNKQHSAEYILAPQVGDVYQMKTEAGEYSLAKVSHVNGDTTYLLFHQYSTDKISGLNKLREKGNEGYDSIAFPVETVKLKTLLEDGSIMEVERK